MALVRSKLFYICYHIRINISQVPTDSAGRLFQFFSCMAVCCCYRVPLLSAFFIFVVVFIYFSFCVFFIFFVQKHFLLFPILIVSVPSFLVFKCDIRKTSKRNKKKHTHKNCTHSKTFANILDSFLKIQIFF